MGVWICIWCRIIYVWNTVCWILGIWGSLVCKFRMTKRPWRRQSTMTKWYAGLPRNQHKMGSKLVSVASQYLQTKVTNTWSRIHRRMFFLQTLVSCTTSILLEPCIQQEATAAKPIFLVPARFSGCFRKSCNTHTFCRTRFCEDWRTWQVSWAQTRLLHCQCLRISRHSDVQKIPPKIQEAKGASTAANTEITYLKRAIHTLGESVWVLPCCIPHVFCEPNKLQHLWFSTILFVIVRLRSGFASRFVEPQLWITKTCYQSMASRQLARLWYFCTVS